MKKYLTRKNIGFALAALLAVPICMSGFFKIIGSAQPTEMLASNGMRDWVMIVGIGELISIILFLIPKTMRLGAILLAAYFGGAIVFHMTHDDPTQQPFTGATIYLLLFVGVAWIRGLDLVSLQKSNE